MTSRRYATTVLFVTAVLYAGAMIITVIGHSHFIDDDFENFYLTLHKSFWKYLVTRIDDQFVPLHRLFTYLLYKLAPLNFPFAVAVLVVLHALGVWYLDAILRLLGDSPANKVLLFLYATNVYWFVPLMWWSSGIHRFSYVLLSVICIYHYLRYRDTSDRRHLLGAFTALVATFLVYNKAILLPFYLLGLELCLKPRSRGLRPEKRLLPLAPFFAAALTHIVLYRIGIPEAFGRFTLDTQYLAAFVTESFYFLSLGMLTVVYDLHHTALTVLITLSWGGFIAYSVARRPANAWIWFIALGVIALNFLLIASSPRNVFGLSNVLTHRYYFELMFLAVIFLKLLLSHTPAPRLLSGLPGTIQKLPSSALLQTALILAYASLSFVHSRILMDTPRYARHNQTRVYMENLSAGVARLKAEPPSHLSFVEGSVPEYLTGFKWQMRPYTIFLQLFQLEASYGVLTENLYTVIETGEIRKVE